MTLSRSSLMEWLDYSPETGIFTWKLSPNKQIKVGSRAGTIQFGGYRVIGINRKLYRCSRLAILFTTGYWPADYVDHINGDRGDDSIGNLREATPSQNAWNYKLPVTNTSGKKGVTWCKSSKKWRAQITRNNKNSVLGCFDDIEDAAAAYDRAALEYFGDYAKTNEQMANA